MNIKHILDMGGYAMYVWPAYAITLAVFVGNLVVSVREHIRIKKLIKETLHLSS